MTASPSRAQTTGARTCPQCRDTLVFADRHPILTVSARLELTGSEVGDRIRYEPAWVCRNGACDYRERMGGN